MSSTEQGPGPAVPPPPGWYPDPWDPRGRRFWDGYQWRQAAAGPAPAAYNQTGTTGPQARSLVAPSGKAYAGFWRRVLGYLIDGLIFAPLSLLVLIPTMGSAFGDLLSLPQYATSAQIQAATQALVSAELRYVLWSLLLVLPLQALYAGELVARFGHTWGQQAAGLRVTRDDGISLPSRGQAYGRWAALIGSGLVSLSWLACLWMLWEPRRRTVQDILASTVVVLEH